MHLNAGHECINSKWQRFKILPEHVDIVSSRADGDGRKFELADRICRCCDRGYHWLTSVRFIYWTNVNDYFYLIKLYRSKPCFCKRVVYEWRHSQKGRGQCCCDVSIQALLLIILLSQWEGMGIEIVKKLHDVNNGRPLNKEKVY